MPATNSNRNSASSDTITDTNDRAALIIRWSAAIGLAACFLSFLWFLYAERNNPSWQDVEFNHFPATVGLPLAAAASFIVVALFRSVEGRIRFEAWGLKFEGA